MEFKKITISLPRALYAQGMGLVHKGLFSNFSDLVRSGIRTEFRVMEPVINDFDESLYKDEELVAGVQQSMREAREGKGRILKTDKEMDRYLEEL